MSVFLFPPFFSFVQSCDYNLPDCPGKGRWVIWSGGIYRAARRTCGRVGVNPERRLQMCAAGAPARLPFGFRHLLSSAFFPVVCLLRNVACRRPVARVSCCCWFASWRSVGTAGDQATWALFSSPQKAKSFQDFPSHRILRHMHEALNIDESKN